MMAQPLVVMLKVVTEKHFRMQLLFRRNTFAVCFLSYKCNRPFVTERLPRLTNNFRHVDVSTRL